MTVEPHGGSPGAVPRPAAPDPAETAEAAGGSGDDDLFALLRRTVAQAAPEPVRAAARDALARREPAAALAAVVADSAELPPELAASVRATGHPRLLTFASDDMSIDIEVDEEPELVSMVGQVAPTGPAQIAVDHGGGVTRTTADELGRFRVNGVVRGPVRLRCTPPATGTSVQTEWLLL